MALLAVVGLVLPRGARAQFPAPPVTADAPLVFGGYGGVVLTHVTDPASVHGGRVNELSAALLAWGQLGARASYLVELDMAKRSTETWTGRESDEKLAPERLYVEVAASDLLRVRAGRFLTPIGQWNENHAEPLTWSPTRPLTTYRPFAKSLTGLLAGGRTGLAGRDVGYAAFWAPASTLDQGLDRSEEASFAGVVGARVAAEPLPGFIVGVSGASARRSRPLETMDAAGSAGLAAARAGDDEEDEEDEREEDLHRRTILGADLRWESPRAEVLAEGVWVTGTEDEKAEGGAFLLGALRLAGPLWGVARVESFRPVQGRRADLGYVGFTLRADARLVVKVGYQFSRTPTERLPDGWFLSFSSLF